MEPSEPRREASSSGGKSKSRLRWLIPRFSLRTLLVLVTLFAVALGIWVERSERQRRICRALDKLGSTTHWGELPAHLKRLPQAVQKYGDGHYVRDITALRVRHKNGEEMLRLAAGLPCLTKLIFENPEPTLESVKLTGALTGLREIEVQNSTIDDDAVSHWTDLQQLEKLNLSQCRISDEGCRHIAKLRRLRELNLDGNIITDAGAAEIAKLRNLESLTMGATYISDQGVRHFAALTKLQMLDLWITRVTSDGVKALAGSPNLKTLRLGYTDVDESCIDAVRQLPKLEELWIEDTLFPPHALSALVGKPNFKGMMGGRVTDLGQAMEVAAPLLEEDRFPRQLEHIFGDGNLLEFLLGRTNDAPPDVSLWGQRVTKQHWARLGEGAKSYTRFNLSNTELDDEDLAHFDGAKAITTLAIADTRITDKGLATIAKMTNLISLDLSGTQMTDDGLAQLSNLNKLETLTLNRTDITDAGLAHLKGLVRLVDLQLDQTQVTKAGVQTLTSLTRLKTLVAPHPEELFQSGSPRAIWPSLEATSPTDGMARSGMRGFFGSEAPDPPTWSLHDSALNFGLPLAGSEEELTVHHLEVTDELCRQIAAEKKLRGLRIQKSRLDDRQFELLLPHEGLRWLEVSDADITDESIDRLSKLHNLWVLKINGTKITPQGLARLLMSSKFRILALSSSQLKDVVVEALSRSSVTNLHIIGDSPPIEMMKGIASIKSMNYVRTYHEDARDYLGRDGMDLLLGKTLHPSTGQISVAGPFFDDDLCANIADYRLLRDFRARNTTITEKTIDQLNKCRFLRSLDLSHTNVTSESLARLPKFEYLSSLSMGGCDIDDQDLRHLAGFSGLTSLSLSNNPITDESIDTLATMKRLRHLYLFNTKCTPQGVRRLRERLPYCRIETTKSVFD